MSPESQGDGNAEGVVPGPFEGVPATVIPLMFAMVVAFGLWLVTAMPT